MMKKQWIGTVVASLFFVVCASAAEEGKHLFILSGQSNMQLHDPAEAFTPTVAKAFGEGDVIVVQHALGGLPIYRWYKDWVDAEGRGPKEIALAEAAEAAKDSKSKKPRKAPRASLYAVGDYYDTLMEMVAKASGDAEIKSVSFFWMQGERDAKLGWGNVYEKSLVGLLNQLRGDLGRDDVNIVIGRLSDYDKDGKMIPDWPVVRKIQMRVAKAEGGVWIDTDDLNTGLARNGKDYVDDLHYAAASYAIFGKRMANAAIKMIKKKGK